MPAKSDTTNAAPVIASVVGANGASDPRWLLNRSIIAALGRCGVRDDGVEYFLEFDGLEGLDQVIVESSLAHAPAILVLSVAGERHQDQRPAGRRFSQLRGDFVAVHLGQADIEQDDLGLK